MHGYHSVFDAPQLVTSKFAMTLRKYLWLGTAWTLYLMLTEVYPSHDGLCLIRHVIEIQEHKLTLFLYN